MSIISSHLSWFGQISGGDVSVEREGRAWRWREQERGQLDLEVKVFKEGKITFYSKV
jgi:hypothetical protein